MQLAHSWAQVKDLTSASLKARYRKTWAGFIWVLFNPILMFGVQSLVFKKFLKIDVEDYPLFLLGGLLPWIFFSSTVLMGTPLFVSQAHLLKSFKVNPLVVLSAQVLDNFINFSASFLLILVPFYVYSDRSISLLLLTPVALIPLLMGTLAVTLILSTLNVFYRDISFVMGFVFSLLFFLTPIFYPQSFVPAEYQWLMKFNPILSMIDPFRSLIYVGDMSFFLSQLLYGLWPSLVLSVLAIWIWKRKRNEFYHRI